MYVTSWRYITLWHFDIITISDSYCLTGQFLKKALVEYIGVCTDTNYVVVSGYNNFIINKSKQAENSGLYSLLTQQTNK